MSVMIGSIDVRKRSLGWFLVHYGILRFGLLLVVAIAVGMRLFGVEFGWRSFASALAAGLFAGIGWSIIVWKDAERDSKVSGGEYRE